MSIVSGISTAPGIAPLLNAPRETQQSAPLDSVDGTVRTGTVGAGKAVSSQEHARPVIGVAQEANAGQSTDIRASSDDRYSRFVKAVQALRIDPTDEILDDRRVAELIAAAEGFFLVDDGVPREVQPLPHDASIKIEPLAPEPEPEFPESALQDRLTDAEAQAKDAKEAESRPTQDRTDSSDAQTRREPANQAEVDPPARTEERRAEANADQDETRQDAAQAARAEAAAESDRSAAEAAARRDAHQTADA